MATMIVTDANCYEMYEKLQKMRFKGAKVRFEYPNGQVDHYGWAKKDDVLWYCLRVLWDAKLVISF